MTMTFGGYMAKRRHAGGIFATVRPYVESRGDSASVVRARIEADANLTPEQRARYQAYVEAINQARAKYSIVDTPESDWTRLPFSGGHQRKTHFGDRTNDRLPAL